MGMTEDQIEQARRRLSGDAIVGGEEDVIVGGKDDAIVEGEFDKVAEAQPARPDSPNGLLTLLIASSAGYLVAFTATTWFDLGLAGFAALAGAVVWLFSRRFFAGTAGVLGLMLFAGVGGAYYLQDTPAIARFAAPYIATIDGDYLCRAVVCQRTGPASDRSKTQLLAQSEARTGDSGNGAAAGETGAKSQASSPDAGAIRTPQTAGRVVEESQAAVAAQNQQRLAEQEQLRLAEKERLAEEERQRQLAAQLRQQQLEEQQRRQRAAEEQKDRRYRAAISNYEFPSSNCRRPAVPSTDASDYVLTRFDNAVADYSECVESAIGRDERAVARLVQELDGRFQILGDGYAVDVWQRFSEPLQYIVDSLVERTERRVRRHNELADAIDRRNERVSREQYWAGIQESVDRFEYEMEQQRQRTWENWNNNNVYVSPGYK